MLTTKELTLSLPCVVALSKPFALVFYGSFAYIFREKGVSMNFRSRIPAGAGGDSFEQVDIIRAALGCVRDETHFNDL